MDLKNKTSWVIYSQDKSQKLVHIHVICPTSKHKKINKILTFRDKLPQGPTSVFYSIFFLGGISFWFEIINWGNKLHGIFLTQNFQNNDIIIEENNKTSAQLKKKI